MLVSNFLGVLLKHPPFYLFSLFILLSFEAALSHATDEIESELYRPNLKELSEKPQWLNLIHYQKSFLRGHKSLAQGENFFFSKNGKTSPFSELEKTLQAFIHEINAIHNDSSICRFPARFLYLSKHIPYLKKRRYQLQQCSEFQAFKSRLNAEAVALVFSSYYINSPASAYGHTLLRFMKSPDKSGEQYQLLDYAVNYSANVTTTNDFLYAFYGLTGFFQGEFAVMPYFYKLREYSDYESRDLWSYKLDLTNDQINMLISHIWEMRQTHFKYYYLTQNCSYHMLSILDVANPEWNLVQRNPYLVIPVDTIKTIVETKDLNWELSYHPSKLREAMTRTELLKKNELRLLKKFLNKDQPVEDIFNEKSWRELTPESRANVLDAAIDMIDFRHAQDVLFTHQQWHQRKSLILLNRSRLGVSAEPLVIERPSSEIPHLGHGSRRFGIGLGHGSESDEYLEISYRLSYHDLYDPPQGHFQNSSIEMGKLNLRYYNDDNKLKVEEFTILNVHNIPPYQTLFFSPSWNVGLGLEKYRQDSSTSECQACGVFKANFGIGASFQIKKLHTSLFLQSEALFSKKLNRRGFRLATGPKLHTQWQFGDKTKIGIKMSALNAWPSSEETNSLKYQVSPTFRRGISRNSAFGVEASFEKYENNATLLYFHYF